MQSRKLVNGSHFDLEPVLLAVRQRNTAVLLKMVDQGYLPIWADHITHKTLQERLGEDGDIESIRFAHRFFSQFNFHTEIDDAFLGAAATNHSLEFLESISDLRDHTTTAVIGAAKGKHRKLIEELVNRNGYVNVAYTVFGAAMAGDDGFASSQYLKAGSHHVFATELYLRGAALSGHAVIVERLLTKDSDYRIAMIAAAERGNAKLVAKIFSIHTCCRVGDKAALQTLIQTGLIAAARHGKTDLVLDFFARARLIGMDLNVNTLPQALSDSLLTHRYAIAKLLLQHGASLQHVVPTDREFSLPEMIRMFTAFADPELCYHIASVYDRSEHRGTRQLLPVMKTVYGLDEFNFNDVELDLYINNKPLVTWLISHKHGNILPKDLLAFLGSYLTMPPHVASQSMQLNQHQIKNFMEKLQQHQSQPVITRTLVEPCPDPVTVEIKRKISAELEQFIQSSDSNLKNRAQDLQTVINELWCIESVFMQIKDQLVQGVKYQKIANAQSIFDRLVERPAAPRRSFFHAPKDPSRNLIRSLENCLAFFADYSSHPAVQALLGDEEIQRLSPKK